MRSVILNMMIMGAIGCVIGEDVAAKNYDDYANAWINSTKISKTQNTSSVSKTNAAKKVGSNLSKAQRTSSVSQTMVKSNSHLSRTRSTSSVSQTNAAKIVNKNSSANGSSNETPYWWRRDNGVELNDSADRSSEASVPLSAKAPSPSQGAGVPPPPPPLPAGIGVPPPPPGMAGAVAAIQTVNISEYLEKYKKDLNTFLKDSGIILFAKIINLRLRGNKEEISKGIANCEKNVIQLRSQLSECLEELEKSEDQDVLHIRRTLGTLNLHLNKLTLNNYLSEQHREKTFGILKNFIEGVACGYFEIIKASADKLKTVPYLRTLKTTQNIVERSLILSQSFYDLVRLSTQEKVEFSDKEMKEICSLFKLKSVIPSRIADIEKRENDIKEAIEYKSDKIPENIEITIKLPTGKTLRERDCLKEVLDLINGIFEGKHLLKKLFKLRQQLDNKYAEIIIPSKGIASLVDPINILMKMDEKVDTTELLDLAVNDFEVSSYTQLGPRYKAEEGDYGGGALISSIVTYRELASLPVFKVPDTIRKWVASKKLTGNSILEYVKLISYFTNVSSEFTKNACDVIKSKSEEVFELSSFRLKSEISSRKKSEQKKDKQALLKIVRKDNKKEKVIDLNDDLFFKSLLKNCKEYVEGLLTVVEDLKMTSQVAKDAWDIFGENGGNAVGYANRVLESYLKFNSSFNDGNRIAVEMVGTNSLTEKDIPNILFAFAQHRDSMEDSSMIMFPKATDEDKTALLDIIKTLSNNLKLVVNAMQNQNDNKELDVLIEEVENLRKSIMTSEEIRAEEIDDFKTTHDNRLKSAVSKINNVNKVTKRFAER